MVEEISVMRTSLIFAGVVLFWLPSAVVAQRTASTALVVRIEPEQRLSVSQVGLQFRVSAGGAGGGSRAEPGPEAPAQAQDAETGKDR